MNVRPATRQKLGAVIVGEGFSITEDGVLSVNENITNPIKYAEFTRERLEEIFEQSKNGGGE